VKSEEGDVMRSRWFLFAVVLYGLQSFAAAATIELLVNPSNEEPLVGGEIPGWTEVVGTLWKQRSMNPTAFDGTHYFYADDGASAELAQLVDVSAFATEIDEGLQVFNFSGRVSAFDQEPPDQSRIVVEYLDDLGTVLEQFDSGNISSVGTWQAVSDSRTAPVGTRFINVRLISTRRAGINNDGYYDALSLTTEELEGCLDQLQAFASDPNLVCGSCDDLYRYIEQVGATCASGAQRPGTAGCTSHRFTSEFNFSFKFRQKGEQICVTAQMTAQFDVNSQITKITWEPSPAPCNNSACQDELNAWQNRIDVHEQHHVQDAINLVAAANKKWQKPKTYRACATTEEDAVQQVRSQGDIDLANEVARLERESAELGQKFDKKDPLPLPRCEPCAPCK
jgi:hypothetical protein